MNESILNGKVCPYCLKESELVPSTTVYRKDYGSLYMCKDCDAYVGTHKGTNKAKGRLANKELREAKKKAHSYFDPLWKKAIANGRNKKEARSAAYKWLAGELGIDVSVCHIGMFDVEMCMMVVDICSKYYNK